MNWSNKADEQVERGNETPSSKPKTSAIYVFGGFVYAVLTIADSITAVASAISELARAYRAK